jgi:hypothetical protein
MSDDTGSLIVWGIIIGSIAYNSNLFESNKITEYTQAVRCDLASSVAKDVNTGRPIKKDADGKWQWYIPDKSEYSCAQRNFNTITYRAYGDAGRIVGIDGAGSMTEYKDCVIADSKNWSCATPSMTMKDGVSGPGHINHLQWILDYVSDPKTYYAK